MCGEIGFMLSFLCIAGTCLKLFKKCTETEVEEEIDEVLRNAPHRPGGPKYKVSHCNTVNTTIFCLPLSFMNCAILSCSRIDCNLLIDNMIQK